MPFRLGRITVWWTASVIVCLLAACSTGSMSDGPAVIRGHTMGTTYTVKITSPVPDTKQVEHIASDIENRLTAVNQQMSTYLDSSEISCFNAFRDSNWFAVSEATAEVVNRALEVSAISGGAFDITVGPLVNLWGFGAESDTARVPTEEQIARVREMVGYHYLDVRMSPPALRKVMPGIYCDLAGIAKGFGVDRIAEYLDSGGINNYCVEIGGEVRTRGRNDRGALWQIGIAMPRETLGVELVVALDSAAMATSGDYRIYFDEGGKRYSHTIDPRTGYPISHRLASVTVIHESCCVADAMATAINVLGPDEGYDLAVRQGLAALLMIHTDDGFVEKRTPAFERLSVTERSATAGE